MAEGVSDEVGGIAAVEAGVLGLEGVWFAGFETLLLEGLLLLLDGLLFVKVGFLDGLFVVGRGGLGFGIGGGADETSPISRMSFGENAPFLYP